MRVQKPNIADYGTSTNEYEDGGKASETFVFKDDKTRDEYFSNLRTYHWARRYDDKELSDRGLDSGSIFLVLRGLGALTGFLEPLSTFSDEFSRFSVESVTSGLGVAAFAYGVLKAVTSKYHDRANVKATNDGSELKVRSMGESDRDEYMVAGLNRLLDANGGRRE